ncbi:hypothetical protein E4T56_gene4633 [Termitomyces sp. T112]|nr:hypothetical protein E4T56_gene4633 [Termitomyces sp. T112]
MSDLASQFEKTMMAHAFLERVDQLLTIACAFLWFKTTGSGVEWLELATVKKECHQLYEQYQGEEWVRPFDVHFAPVNSFLEFLMDDLMAGMMVSAPAVASASDTAKHPVVASEEGEGDVEMRETTPLAIVAEVEQEASNMEVEGEEEFEATPAAIEEDEEEEWAKEGIWSDTLLRQVGDDELEWLGKDLGWPTPLMEELLAAQVHYTVTKQTLATLAGYWHDYQAFLAWQEENNIREGDWEEAEDSVEVPDNDADLNS